MVGLILLLLTASQPGLLLVCAQGSVDMYVEAASKATEVSCGDLSTPCPTLEAAVKKVERMSQHSSVKIHILGSELTLSHPVILQKVTNIELTGSGSVTTVVSCSSVPGVSPPGLVFEAIDNVTIKDLHFTNCGALRKYSTPENSFQHNAVIHLHLCRNVSIDNVNTTANHGTGIAILDAAGGAVTISNSHFQGNQVPQSHLWEYEGGGGIYIRVQGKLDASQSNENNFLIANCTFEHNRASFLGNYSFLTVFNEADEGTGRGGGVDAIFWFNASGNTIHVVDCVFRNNTAYLGGGLAIQIQYVSYYNNIVVERCIFEENGCKEGTQSGSGGGAHFGASFYGNSPLQPHDNHFLIKDTVFRQNCAQLGGGMTIFSSRSSFEEATVSNTYMLDNCSWIENSAHIGAAVDISPHVLGRVQEGFLPTILFKNGQFFNNEVAFQNKGSHQSFGSGTLFSSLFNVDFLGSVHFENNSGSAFIIVNAIANFSMCNSTFIGNSGVQGAAISLIGVASLYIGPGSSYTFIGNHATDRGGAIYSYLIDDHDFAASRSCFLQYSEYDVPGPEWQSKLCFFNNTAGTYGHSIYASSITPCVLHVPREENLYDNYKWDTLSVFRWPEVFVYDNRTENQIATEGGNFILTENPPFPIVPGEEHRLAVVIFDDMGQEVETTFRASMVSNASVMDVGDAFSCLSGNVIQLLGEEGNTGVLLLETVTSRKSSIAMNVTLLPCPPGFNMVERECTCNPETYSAIVSCDLEDFHANIKVGYWVGYIDNTTFSTAVCPLAFCAYNNSNFNREVPLPKIATSSELDEYICGPTRTGVLCGHCSEGYSVHYHSPNFACKESRVCKVGWLFYILSELLPVTLIFVAVLALNISFTSGAVNGFILFSQLLDPVVVGGSGVMEYPSVISILSYGYRVIYGFFTMEYFNIEPLSFCLWEGTTVLDVLVFRYVTFIYAFILVVSTILFLKYCGHKLLGKCLRITTVKNSVIHGLSAFIVLCYAQSTKVSIDILITVYVRGENGDTLSPKRVWFNGDIAAFSPEHLAYALPAIVCLLTFGVIPPALLLVYPSINKVLAFVRLSEAKMVTAVSKRIRMSKLKPFFDSFQGCFKDDLRFFAGIYFLYRWIALLLYATVPSVIGFYTSLGAAYIFILMIHTVFQPYENRAHNIADGFLLANLALIYSIAGYNYLFSQGTIDTNQIHSAYITTTATIQLILIYLPIIAMVTYIAIMLYRKACPKKKKTIDSKPLVAPQPRPSVTSTTIGLEEFPKRMLETEYEEFKDGCSDDPPKARTCIANPLVINADNESSS